MVRKGDKAMKIAERLQKILDEYKNKRVIVVGTTSSGKSTLLKKIKNAEDMDDLVFPLLSKEEKNYVCQSVWTEEIGKTMTRLVKEKVKVEKGKPLFGTVILGCDLIIYLDINDELLKERCKKRKTSFKSAKDMQKMILREIAKSKIHSISFQID